MLRFLWAFDPLVRVLTDRMPTTPEIEELLLLRDHGDDVEAETNRVRINRFIERENN